MLAATACTDPIQPAPRTRLSVTVAPLALPLMTDACYDLTVFDTTDPAELGPATMLWAQRNMCASQYGADGGIRFTGYCDAAAGAHAVRLVLRDVYKDGTFKDGTRLEAGTDYVNPCPLPASDGAGASQDNGCILSAPCVANQDVKLTFNLTLMRNASLGFFDTAVKFKDVFCAAKVDCVEADGVTPLTYLHDPGTGLDGATAVLAFACTGGPGASGAFLYLDTVLVTCRDDAGQVTRRAAIDPSAEAGNVTPVQTPSDAPPILFGAALSRGDGLNNSAFWNVLMGLRLGGAPNETCTVSTKGFASEAALPHGTTPAGTRYPVIDWDVELSAGPTRTCTRHPLNHSDGDVETVYTAIDTPQAIAYQMQRGTGGAVVDVHAP